MTKAQLKTVYDALVELIDGWNDAAADDDRGRSNDAIVLTLWDDGSGHLRIRPWSRPDEIEDLHRFDNFEEFVEILGGYMGIEFDVEESEGRPS